MNPDFKPQYCQKKKGGEEGNREGGKTWGLIQVG
jgi:hypothetical protein